MHIIGDGFAKSKCLEKKGIYQKVRVFLKLL